MQHLRRDTRLEISAGQFSNRTLLAAFAPAIR